MNGEKPNLRGRANAFGVSSEDRVHLSPRGTPKKGYETQELAERAADALNRVPGASIKRPYVSYECPSCKQWHAGRKPK